MYIWTLWRQSSEEKLARTHNEWQYKVILDSDNVGTSNVGGSALDLESYRSHRETKKIWWCTNWNCEEKFELCDLAFFLKN